MSTIIQTVQSYHSKLRMTQVITHQGFKRIICVNKKNKIIKDIITIYKNHPKNCKCGYTKSEQIVFNSEEVSRTNP